MIYEVILFFDNFVSNQNNGKGNLDILALRNHDCGIAGTAFDWFDYCL